VMGFLTFKIKAFLDSSNNSIINENDAEFPTEARNSKSISGYETETPVA